MEIGLKQGLKIDNWMGYIDVTFLMRYDDMIDLVVGSFISMDQTGLGFKFVNVGKTEISGVEISMNGQGKINENLSSSLADIHL